MECETFIGKVQSLSSELWETKKLSKFDFHEDWIKIFKQTEKFKILQTFAELSIELSQLKHNSSLLLAVTACARTSAKSFDFLKEKHSTLSSSKEKAIERIAMHKKRSIKFQSH